MVFQVVFCFHSIYLYIYNTSFTSSAVVATLAQPVTSLRKINHMQKITPGRRDFLRRVYRRWHQFTRASELNTVPHVAGCYTARHPLIYSLIYLCRCHPERARSLKKDGILCRRCSAESMWWWHAGGKGRGGRWRNGLMCDEDEDGLTSHQTLIWWDVSAWIQTDPVARVLGRRSSWSGCSVLTVTVQFVGVVWN